MRRHGIGLFAFIVLCFINPPSLIIAEGDTSQPPLSAEEVRTNIQEAQRKLLNVRIDSEAWVEEKPTPSASWERTPIYSSSTSWYNGLPNSKARIDFHKKIVSWINGPPGVSFGESEFSIGFDGGYGRTVYHNEGPNDKMYARHAATIESKAPLLLGNQLAGNSTGVAFSVYYCFGDNVNEWLTDNGSSHRSAQELKFQGEIAYENFQGCNCIKISLGNSSKGHDTYWLDPSRGYALLGHELTNTRQDGSEWLIQSLRITKLQEVTPELWFPMEAVLETGPNQPGEPWRRLIYKASNVVANDPHFDDKIFTVPIPMGYLVDNKVEGVMYEAGEAPNELLKTLNNLVSEVTTTRSTLSSHNEMRLQDRKMVANASLSSKNNKIFPVAPLPTRQDNRFSNGYAVLCLIVALVIGVSSLCILMLRRKQSSRRT